MDQKKDPQHKVEDKGRKSQNGEKKQRYIAKVPEGIENQARCSQKHVLIPATEWQAIQKEHGREKAKQKDRRTEYQSAVSSLLPNEQ